MAGLAEWYAALLYTGAAFAAIVGFAVERHRPAAGARELAVFMVGVAIWMTTTATAYATDAFGVYSTAIRITPIGVGLVVVGFFLFTFAYTGRERYLTARTVVALATVPVAATVLAWTNPADLFWVDFQVADTIEGFEAVWGPAYWGYAMYGYTLVFVGTVLLIGTLFRSQYVYQRQIVAVLVGVFAPWIGNAVFLFTSLSIDPAPVAFLVTGGALSWAMLRVDFMDLTPVARDTVVDHVNHGVFVVDRKGRLVDVNPMGERILDLDEGDLGQPLRDFVADYPELVELFDDATEKREEVVLDTSEGRRVFDIEVTPLIDDRGRQEGRLFIVQDVTERRRRQWELERQNERLDQFASVVSHDLRNPLSVAKGYLETVREEHDDPRLTEVANAHGRMEELVDDLLTLARQGETITETEAVDLEAIADDAWQAVDTVGATLSVDANRPIEADPSRLQQLFENLFRNAVEHAGPDVTVRLGLLGDSDRSTGFYVEDDGPGIPESRRERVFDAGVTSDDAGTGLGLAVVRDIAQAHGWGVSVGESESGGARIEVRGVSVQTGTVACDGG